MFDKNIIKLKINDGYIEFKDKSNQKSKLIPIPYRIYRDGKILDYHHFYYKFDKILENIDFNKRDNIILIFDSTSTIHINYKIPKIKEIEIKNFLKLELEDYGNFKLDDYEIFYRHKEEKDILDLSIDLVLKEIILKFKEILDKIGVENFEIIPEAQSIEKNGKYIEISVDYVKYIFVKDNLVNIYKKIYNENIRKLVEENNLEEKNASNIINLRYDPEELKIDEDFNFKFKNYFINDIYEMEKFAEGDRIYFLGNICDSDIIKEILKTYSSLKWNLLDEDIHIKFPERKEKKVKKVNYINLFLIVFSLGIVMANLIYFSNLKKMVENTEKNILTTKNTKLESEDNSSDKFQERNKVFLEKISKIQELENDKLIITAYSFQDGKIIVKGIVKDENYFNEIFKDFDIVNKGFYIEDGFNKLEIGKLKTELLEKYIFNKLSSNRDEVILKSGTGLDNALLDFGDDLIVASTDPITGASKNLGSLAINVSVNDVSCQCADPVGVLLTVLIPPSATINDLKEIIEDANETCKKLKLDIVGGHTEITDAVNKIIISTTVLGRVSRDKRPDVKKVEKGDIVAVSKYIGIEGTSIISNEKDEINKILDEEEVSFANSLSEEISVLKESKIASKYNVKHMHDITEGGLFGALWETTIAINHGIKVDYCDIPILEITEKISRFYNIDPCRLISSGSMLMIFNKDDFKRFKEEAETKNIKVTSIGEITADKKCIVIKDKDEIVLNEPDSDELYKVIS